jgi:ribose transport system substrate-binding protein
VGFDGLPRTIKYIRQGRVTATVAQDTVQMGKQSVDLAVKVAQGKAVPAEILIAPYIIDRDFLAEHDY